MRLSALVCGSLAGLAVAASANATVIYDYPAGGWWLQYPHEWTMSGWNGATDANADVVFNSGAGTVDIGYNHVTSFNGGFQGLNGDQDPNFNLSGYTSLQIRVKVGAANSAIGLSLHDSVSDTWIPFDFANGVADGSTGFVLITTPIPADLAGKALHEIYFRGNGDAGHPQVQVQLDQLSAVSVPEPAALGLLGVSAAGLMARRRRA